MDWFGEQDLGVKYAIVLGSLITLVVVAGFCKLFYIKRRTRKFAKEQEIASSTAKEELHTLNKRDLEEGDLFGVRALERGFYGGVAQSRPGTPVSFGSKSTLIAKPGSAHVSSRPGSSNGPNGKLGVNGPGLRVNTGGSEVDMHLAVPPSPTVQRRTEEQQRSASPTAAPQLQLPQVPTPGLGMRSPAGPTSPRLKVHAPSPVITHNSAIFSERGSLGDVQRLPPFSPESTHSPSRENANYFSGKPQGPPVIPTIQFSDEDRVKNEPLSPRAPVNSEAQARVSPSYQPRRTSMIGNNHLSVAGGDGGDNKGGADQRASTASFGGIYDSYFDGRLSVIPDHDRSSTYSITSDGNDHNGQYRPSSIASTSTTSSFSFPAFRPDHRPQSGDTYQVRM